MAELVDALGSGPNPRKRLRVQVPLDVLTANLLL